MLYLGLVLNLVIPLGLLAIGFFLRKDGVGANPTLNLKLFFWVLIFVSVSESLAIFIFKKSFLAKFSQKSQIIISQIMVQKTILTFSVVIFALSLAPSIYGLVYLLLGGSMEEFILFIVITFLEFRIFKPKLEEIRKLAGSVTPT